MRQAFSLVELSIVLVILGLLTGGILAGQSLIRAAELRNVTTEYNRYVTAVGAFRDKYFAIPGDMNNAINFWGAAHATPSTCQTTIGTGTQTCNGDGNGMVQNTATSREHFRFWQQLANAGLIEGSYTGVEANVAVGSTYATAVNSPKSKLGTGLWWTINYGTVAAGASMVFAGSYGNAFELSGIVANDQPYAPLAKPEEMWNIDTKMDDGKPGSGKLWVRAGSGGVTTCTTAATDTAAAAATAAYRLDNTSLLCSFIWQQVY